MSFDRDAWEPDEVPRQSQRRYRWLWPVVVAVGLAAYELTAQPGLAAAIICAKFGWDDFATALWVWRKDPNRPRGRTCSSFLLAAGLSKTVATACVVAFLIMLSDSIVRPLPPGAGGPGPPDQFIGAVVTIGVGLALGTVTTLAAAVLALHSGTKLWFDGQLHRDRRAGRWPPTLGATGRNNQARAVLRFCSFIMLETLGLTYLIGLFALPRLLSVPRRDAESIGELYLFVGSLCQVFGLIGIYYFQSRVAERLVARSPAECWSADTDEGHSFPQTEELPG